MKTLALALVSAGILSACATATPAPMVEQGYSRGSLGVAAIQREDWAAAEAGLMRARDVRADDPARLINLGKVYLETGRTGEALSAWRLALASDRHVMVETMGGQFVSTRVLAERALAAHERGVQTAGR